MKYFFHAFQIRQTEKKEPVIHRIPNGVNLKKVGAFINLPANLASDSYKKANRRQM